jgi:phosphatidylglycerol:prolipoprotein diacylglycerol transferase
MLPVLLDLKIIKIYTFGVFLVLAFFWGAFWLWRNIKLTSYKEEDVFDGLFVSLFGALFTARIFYVALNLAQFGLNPLKFILINGYPGLSLVGGFIGGFLTMLLYTRFKRIPFMHIVDYIMSALFLALAIGKLGAFFAGTELGSQTNFFLRVHYVGAEGARHIVALYESFLFFIGFYISHSIMFLVRRETMQRGLSFFFFIAYFSLTQLLLDFMKQNHLYLAELSFNLVVSAIVCSFATIYLIIQYRQSIIETTKNFTANIKIYGKRRTNKTSIY